MAALEGKKRPLPLGERAASVLRLARLILRRPERAVSKERRAAQDEGEPGEGSLAG